LFRALRLFILNIYGVYYAIFPYHIDEVKQGLTFMASVNDRMGDTDLHHALRRAEAINRRNWEIPLYLHVRSGHALFRV
jgi:hypothetical protein